MGSLQAVPGIANRPAFPRVLAYPTNFRVWREKISAAIDAADFVVPQNKR
jgi:hypothetical protein